MSLIKPIWKDIGYNSGSHQLLLVILIADYLSSYSSVQQIIPFEVSGCANERFSEARELHISGPPTLILQLHFKTFS